MVFWAARTTVLSPSLPGMLYVSGSSSVLQVYRDPVIVYSSGYIGYSKLSDLTSTYNNQEIYDTANLDWEYVCHSIFKTVFNLYLSRLKQFITFTEFPQSNIVNPARALYHKFTSVVTNVTTQKFFGLGKDLMDCVIFGMVVDNGSRLVTPDVDNQDREQKYLRFMPLSCEGARALAACREVLYRTVDPDDSVTIRSGPSFCPWLETTTVHGSTFSTSSSHAYPISYYILLNHLTFT